MRSFNRACVAAIALCCVATTADGQSSQPNAVLNLSEPVRITYYPEIICPHCILPYWDRDYLLHREIDKDPALVSMFDRDGKKVLEVSFKPSGAVSASVAATGSTHSGGILATGGLITKEGTVRQFIARTNAEGQVVELITSAGAFRSRQVCETPDGNLWTLGYDSDSRNTPDADKNILRRFDNQGMAGSFISFDSIGDFQNFVSEIAYRKSYLYCGAHHVSLYLGPYALYIEVDASSGKVTRWNVDMSSVVGSKTEGFAVTDEGRIFVALTNSPEPGDQHKVGLYELTAPATGVTASLTPVKGTIAFFPWSQRAPDSALVWLWGADGNELVVSTGDSRSLSWVRVLAKEN